MIKHKGEFYRGLFMMLCFLIVLGLVFSPIFKDKDGNSINGLQWMDNLYNSISKGSAYYIPQTQEVVDEVAGTNVTVTLGLEDAEQAQRVALLYEASGARVEIQDAKVVVTGDLAAMLSRSLVSSERMYNNQGAEMAAAFGFNPAGRTGDELVLAQDEFARQVQYDWYVSLKALHKDLTNQELFADAKVVHEVMTKAVETAYNYFGVVPEKVSTKWAVLLGSLVFYVVYTLWYGFAILFMFEGWGLKLEH